MTTTPDEREIDHEEFRVLSKASGGAGLYLVPTDMATQIAAVQRFMGSVASLATVVVTDSGDTFNVPAATAHGTAAWIAESGTYTPSDETLGRSR